MEFELIGIGNCTSKGRISIENCAFKDGFSMLFNVWIQSSNAQIQLVNDRTQLIKVETLTLFSQF